jgi:hypothetical protein
MNAAKCAIQTYKDAFIAALAKTDRDFPIQLWDKLAPQVQDTLNLLRASRINPAISAYKILNGPYDWNRYSLAPLGCKAIVYKDGDTRGSWASRGMDGWYLGPSQDHYRYDLYYIPETRAYQISSSTELFPQHCQVLNLTAHQHFWALTEKLAENTTVARATPKGRRLIKLLQSKINTILTPPDSTATQRAEQRVREEEQRAIDKIPILTIPRITNAPPIMQAYNPMSKQALKNTPQIHRRVTRNNMPGRVPMINKNITIPESGGLDMMPQQQRSPQTVAQETTPPTTVHLILSRARQRIVTQQAINVLTIQEKVLMNTMCTPHVLMIYTVKQLAPNFEHYANPMVHPITGKIISSYKKLMHDSVTADIWQTAFGKDFRGMAQGGNKTSQKGTNAMFVMNHEEIKTVLKAGKKFMYANLVVNHRPQKADPDHIRITAGGNLIKCDCESLVPTADIDTANSTGTVWSARRWQNTCALI